MAPLLLDVFIVYLLGLFLVPNLRAGSWPRRLLELAYWPLARLGLWHRWSMYSPEVPDGTRIALTGVLLDDGSFEVVPLPGFDDDTGFGKAHGLRFIGFQSALCVGVTDYLKPALCDEALRLWRSRQSSSGLRPVAVEVRVYWYPSPEPGERGAVPEPEVQTVWSEKVSPEGDD